MTLLASLSAAAQTNTAKGLCLNPACPITYAYGATDTVFVEINTTDGFPVGYWRQISGPAIALPKDTTIWNTSVQAFDGFYLKNAPAGTYVLQDSVVTRSGSMATQQVTFTVLPPATACPTIPPGSNRITTWTVVQVGGISRILVTYWDGSTGLLP